MTAYKNELQRLRELDRYRVKIVDLDSKKEILNEEAMTPKTRELYRSVPTMLKLIEHQAKLIELARETLNKFTEGGPIFIRMESKYALAALSEDNEI